MVIAGCSGVGISLAYGYRREILMLCQLEKILNDMEWELQYRQTPLPELCQISAADYSGVLKDVFLHLREELLRGEQPDVRTAMTHVIAARRMPERIRKHLQYLGSSLGRYDLQGQIQGLRGVKECCRKERNELEKGKTERLRGYQTLALCAGAAIVIILI